MGNLGSRYDMQKEQPGAGITLIGAIVGDPKQSYGKLPRIRPIIKEEQEGFPRTFLVKDPLVTSDTSPEVIIFPSTLTRFLGSRHLAEVELSLRKRKLPDSSETSLEECDEVDHQNLIDALNGKRMKFDVADSRFIFLKDVDNQTFLNLELLVDQLQCDLIVSGGWSCTYSSNTVSDEIETAQRITMDYESKFPNLNYVQGHELKVALMDTGCRESLRNKVNEQGRISMPDKMIQVVCFDESTAASSDGEHLVEVPYADSLNHGTAVAEILVKFLPQNSSLIIASLGENILISNVIRVLLELKKRGVKIINCSFHVDSESIHLTNVLEELYEDGVVVVASAGNKKPGENIPKSALHTEHTIVVGGHNHIDLISPLSLEACNVDACCLGENVYIEHPQPSVWNGTSFAAAYVTLVLTRRMSLGMITPDQAKKFLISHTSPLLCTHCGNAGTDGHSVNLKIDFESINASLESLRLTQP